MKIVVRTGGANITERRPNLKRGNASSSGRPGGGYRCHIWGERVRRCKVFACRKLFLIALAVWSDVSVWGLDNSSTSLTSAVIAMGSPPFSAVDALASSCRGKTSSKSQQYAINLIEQKKHEGLVEVRWTCIGGRHRLARASWMPPSSHRVTRSHWNSLAAPSPRRACDALTVVVSCVYASSNHDSRSGGGGADDASRARARTTAETQRARRLTRWETNVDRRSCP